MGANAARDSRWAELTARWLSGSKWAPLASVWPKQSENNSASLGQSCLQNGLSLLAALGGQKGPQTSSTKQLHFETQL